jgi:hypothetical protein
MGVWQGVNIDSLKFHPGLPCPTFLRPVGRQPFQRWSTRKTACGLAVFHLFEHPTPYTYGPNERRRGRRDRTETDARAGKEVQRQVKEKEVQRQMQNQGAETDAKKESLANMSMHFPLLRIKPPRQTKEQYELD